MITNLLILMRNSAILAPGFGPVEFYLEFWHVGCNSGYVSVS